MIPNVWYAVLESTELPKDKPVGVTRLGKKMVFWRDGDDGVCCIADKCAHRGASLSGGFLTKHQLRCPFHGFRYDKSGRVTQIPANGKNTPVPENFKVDSYHAAEKHGFIWVYNYENADESNLPNIPWFDNLDETYIYSTEADPWKTHYSRVIENQLDVVHVPYVHHNTIGKGCKTLVHGPIAELDGNILTIWMKNVFDGGNIRQLKPQEMKKEESPVTLQFIFPNIWQNRISEKLSVMIAFSPVDDENTVTYIRFYQRFMKIPLFVKLIHYFGNKYNLKVARQDRTVVETQLPKRSDIKIGENLVQGDTPVVLYRKRRRELIDSKSI